MLHRTGTCADVRRGGVGDVPLYRRDAPAAGPGASTARRSSPRTWRRPWSSPAGAPTVTATLRPAAHPGRRATPAAAARAGTEADPVLLEVFANLFMAIAEQMGERLRVDRALGQHQGAARLLLRDLRRRRRPDRERAAHPGAPGLHGRIHKDGDKSQRRRRMKPGRRLRAQRPLPRRHPPARCHRCHSRLRSRGRRAGHLVLRRLARPSRGDRRHLPRLHARGQHQDRGGGRPHRQLAAGRERPAAGGGDARPADRRRVPVAEPADQPRRPAGADRRQREGRGRSCAAWSRSTASTSCTPTWGTCRTTPRRRSAASSPRSATAQCDYEIDNGARIRVAVHGRPRGAGAATIDFTGTTRSSHGNFNAPSSVAMAAVLYVFRTLVDKDIPLNAGCLKPLTVIIPPGTMLSPGYPAAVAAGNVETCQAVTGALYAALGIHGGRLGHDEQRHVRQRAVPVLRDGRERLGRGRRASTAPTWSRPR